MASLALSTLILAGAFAPEGKVKSVEYSIGAAMALTFAVAIAAYLVFS
ncbi:MAG: hypothetical protein ACP5K9_00860 [Candidatus Micrarchaeia archaeon]